MVIAVRASGATGLEQIRITALCQVVKPDNPIGSRFELQNPSKIPRMYHSTAMLLRDEKVIDVGQLTFTTRVIVPSSCNLTPSQYYLLFVVHQEVPSQGIWVEL
ncbi:hypothetical protein Leryth_020909 [Lithospermum erythrorhizon]|nr:hypothetical protein Leryth_020909 [Lithospermum erythrorhizon]